MPHIHYYPDDKGDKQQKVKYNSLLYSGKLSNVSSWGTFPETHSFCEVLYIISGSNEVKINNDSFSVKSGDIVVYNQGSEHMENMNVSGSEINFLFFAIDGLEVPLLPLGYMIDPNIAPVFNAHKFRYQLESLFTNLLLETNSRNLYQKQMCDSLLLSILILIQRISSSRNDASVSEFESTTSKIKNFIDSNYTKTITLDTLSEVLFISRHHLAHIFKKEMGVSPIKYTIIRRMEEAKRLLLESSLSVSSISEMLGYENPLYFSQMFKKTIGVSPTTFRLNNK